MLGAEFEAAGLPSPVGNAKYLGPALARYNYKGDSGTFCDGCDTFNGDPLLGAGESRVIQYGNSEGSYVGPEARIWFIPSFDGHFEVKTDIWGVKFTNTEYAGEATEYGSTDQITGAWDAYHASPNFCILELYINIRRDFGTLDAYYTPEVRLIPQGDACSKQGIEVYNSPYTCGSTIAGKCNTNGDPNFSAVVMVYRKQSGAASIADGETENVFGVAPAPAPAPLTSTPTSFGTVAASPSKMFMFGLVCAMVATVVPACFF